MVARQLHLFGPLPIPKRKTAVAQTSILSYYEENAKGTFQSLRLKIVRLLCSRGAMTRRQLAYTLKKEPSSLCAALSQLEKNDLVEVVFRRKCPITGKVVSWFGLCHNSTFEALIKANQ